MARFIKAIPLLLALALLASIPSVVSGQSPSCANGTAVTDADDNPGLVADCNALLAARDTLAGSATLNWSADLAIEDWDGLMVWAGRVTGLALQERSLTGQIPAELGSLSALGALNFGNYSYRCTPVGACQGTSPSANRLTGPIPQELSNLSELSLLDLTANQLSGPIPPWLGSLRLSWLDLSANQFTGPIPSELGSLTNLRTLHLRGNQLDGPIPAWLGRLTYLESLDLAQTQSTGSIPAELGNLSNLKGLRLGGNPLTPGPLPAWLGSLTNLENLGLWNARLTGPIPAELGNLSKLREIEFGSNQLTGPIPAELGNLSNLTELRLDRNRLTGPIPAELGRLSKLREIEFGSNQLTGPIPAELGNLSNLTELRLDKNRLTGPIPAELGRLSDLNELSLAYNQLTGCIPAELRGVADNDFDDLGLGFCSGSAPQMDDCATGSAVTDAANNLGLVSDCNTLLRVRDTLAGAATLNWSADLAIEDWDGVTVKVTPQRVTALDLREKQLTGTIPAGLGSLSNLTSLILYDNQLSGEIPASLSNLSNLRGLTLYDNQLSGEIPASLSNLSELRELILHTNRLSGEIPATLGNLSDLEILALSYNRLSGEIPASLGDLANLQSAHFAGNRLTGCVPAGLENVAENDFDVLGRPFCGATTDEQAKYDADGNGLIEVSNLEQLDAIRYDPDGDGSPNGEDAAAAYRAAFPTDATEMVCVNRCYGYELAHSLDFDDAGSYASGAVNAGWTAGDGWSPVGDLGGRYNAILDGNGHTISNLYINRPAAFSAGLFSYNGKHGVIRNLGLVDVDIMAKSGGALVANNSGTVSRSYATGRVANEVSGGGLVGGNGDVGVISHSYATVDVSGTRSVGGLAGSNHPEGKIMTSYATGSVLGNDAVGGLVGRQLGIVSDSYATGNVSSREGAPAERNSVGGLAGENWGTVIACYATGSVSGETVVGGLIGLSADLTREGQRVGKTSVIASYATGSVSGKANVGGLAGFLSRPGGLGEVTVVASYATGSVSGETNVGGLIGGSLRGQDDPDAISITASYWNTETSGQTRGVGDGDSTGAEGKTTAELRAPTGYAGIYGGWNADLENADGDDDPATGTDDFWDFGTSSQYPALKADLDGDGTPTSKEFGDQHRDAPVSAPPVFAENAPVTRDVLENTPEGGNVGGPVAATPAEGETLTYTLGEADAESFDIDAGTGQITVGAGTTLATGDTYEVEVTATGPAGASASITVMLTVTSLLNEYDEDGDQGISKSEAISAVRDYFAGRLSKEQTIAVIRFYFASGG